MNPTAKERLKTALYAILVGTCVTFLSSVLQVFLDYLRGIDMPTMGGVFSTILYAVRQVTKNS
jgi:hypothetical protein